VPQPSNARQPVIRGEKRQTKRTCRKQKNFRKNLRDNRYEGQYQREEHQINQRRNPDDGRGNVQHGTPISPVQPLKDDEKAAFDHACEDAKPKIKDEQVPKLRGIGEAFRDG
jgi:hypothetical protein